MELRGQKQLFSVYFRWKLAPTIQCTLFYAWYACH